MRSRKNGKIRTSKIIDSIKNEIRKDVVGQEDVVNNVIIAIIAGVMYY